jgi:phosphoserine phosphatase RsbX
MSTSFRRSNRPPPIKEPVPSVWSASEPPCVSIAWLTSPQVGESVNGDRVVVRRVEGIKSAVLVGVIDALGHGPKAAVLADSSADYLGRTTHPNVADCVNGLHTSLRGTRGVAALLFRVTEKTFEICSVGNIELRSSNTKLPFVLTPGVLGVRLRQLKVCEVPSTADRFVLYSDGISGRFDLRALTAHSPAELAKHIFATHRRDHDDATVVVVDVHSSSTFAPRPDVR